MTLCRKSGQRVDSIKLTLNSLPDTRICVNFSTVYNDTLVAKGLMSVVYLKPSINIDSTLYMFQNHFGTLDGGHCELITF